MSLPLGWRQDRRGLQVKHRDGHVVAFMFSEGDAYLRVPRWVVRLVAWVARWLL